MAFSDGIIELAVLFTCLRRDWEESVRWEFNVLFNTDYNPASDLHSLGTVIAYCPQILFSCLDLSALLPATPTVSLSLIPSSVAFVYVAQMRYYVTRRCEVTCITLPRSSI